MCILSLSVCWAMMFTSHSWNTNFTQATFASAQLNELGQVTARFDKWNNCCLFPGLAKRLCKGMSHNGSLGIKVQHLLPRNNCSTIVSSMTWVALQVKVLHLALLLPVFLWPLENLFCCTWDHFSFTAWNRMELSWSSESLLGQSPSSAVSWAGSSL